MGEIKFSNLFVDGTKIEAYANKYSFVFVRIKSFLKPFLSELYNTEKRGFSQPSFQSCIFAPHFEAFFFCSQKISKFVQKKSGFKY